MPADKVENMRRWVLEQSVSLDRPVGDEEGRSLAEVLEDPEREDTSPTADLEMDALQSEVATILGELRRSRPTSCASASASTTRTS
jgi:DNA-directed RNA polymerase sigma subunit (sigma70/sigma32)